MWQPRGHHQAIGGKLVFTVYEQMAFQLLTNQRGNSINILDSKILPLNFGGNTLGVVINLFSGVLDMLFWLSGGCCVCGYKRGGDCFKNVCSQDHQKQSF